MNKKKYTIQGIVIGTYNSKTIDIELSLTDDELQRIKEIIKEGDYDDLRQVVGTEFPELYEQINNTLASAAYKYYRKEYMDYYAEDEDDEPGEIELTGEEYSCPIPEEWK